MAAVTSTGQLMVVDTNTLFGDQPANNIEHIFNIYTTWLDAFLAEGYTAIRLSSEVHFGLDEYEPYGKFLELLMRLKRDFFPYYPLTTICQYHRREDDPAILRDAIFASRWILRAGRIYQNPACVSPETYFSEKPLGWEAESWVGTQEALMESEEKYRQIVENSMDMITILDATNFNILYVNPIKCKILGYSVEDLIGKYAFDFIHPDYKKETFAVFLEGVRQESGAGNYYIKKMDDSYIWMEGKGKLVHKVGCNDEIILFSRDIHEKKLAEEALYKSEQKYKNQVDYLNTLINTMNELCLTYDRDTKLTFVNQRLLEAMGYRSEEMLGRSILDFIPDDSIESVLIQINRRMEKGEISSHENTLLCKNGSELLVKLKGSPIIENDNIVGALVLAEDISQQRKLEREMARLGQLNTVGEIAASIGHEIRNPMTTVQGFLQLLSQNKDFIDYQVYFDLMLDELDRANSIISEFLALAKNKIVNLQKSNINKILKTMAPLLMADALNGDKNICFELKNVADILLDEQEIRQLILNLVRNGLEAMSPGGTISIKTTMLEDKVVFSVQDEGVGIPAEMLEKLGTPFFSTKENGTGLGLAVCYSIVDRHHADLVIESSSGGSTFNIHFPSQIIE